LVAAYIRLTFNKKSSTMKLPPAFVKGEEDIVNVIIETPKGCRNKFNFDKSSWLFKLKKVMPSGLVFPMDFGFIPNTKGEDGDPLDVLVAVEQGTYPGCVLECRLLGVIEGEQTEKNGTVERNDRLVAVPEVSIEYARLRDMKDFSEEHLKDLEHFFIYYNKMAGKKYRLLGTKGPTAALNAIKKAMK
jgi:inorganic pyrophosphatase